MRRRAFLSAAAISLLVTSSLVSAEAPGTYRIGVLHATGGRNTAEDVLERRLEELGWVNGRNVTVLYRYGNGNDALPTVAKQLVMERPDVIVTGGTPSSLAAKNATNSIPIVFYTVGDPVGVGLVSSLARPGANVTGISGSTYQLGAKRLEVLRQLLPGAKRFGALLNPTDSTVARVLETLKDGIRAPNVTLEPFYAGRPTDIDAAFHAMKQRLVDAVLVQPDGMFWGQRARIVELAAAARLPAVYAFSEDAQAGGLVSYGATIPGMLNQALMYVDRILRDTKPGELPVQDR